MVLWKCAMRCLEKGPKVVKGRDQHESRRNKHRKRERKRDKIGQTRTYGSALLPDRTSCLISYRILFLTAESGWALHVCGEQEGRLEWQWVGGACTDCSQAGGTGENHCVHRICERCVCLCGCWHRHGLLPRWSSWPLDAIGNKRYALVPAGPGNAQLPQPAQKTSHQNQLPLAVSRQMFERN